MKKAKSKLAPKLLGITVASAAALCWIELRQPADGPALPPAVSASPAARVASAQRAPASPGATPTAPDGPRPAAAPSARPDSAPLIPLSSLGIRVVGTVIGRSAAESSALIVEGEGAAPVVRKVGDPVADGAARITEIGSQRVVVDRGGGRLETLEVGGRAGGRLSASALDSLSADEFFKLPTEVLDDAMERKPPRRLAVDIRQAVTEVRAMARFTRGEGDAGMAVEGFKRTDPLAQLGLQPGDQIVEIDGQPVSSVDAGVDALARSLYSEGGNTILTLERFDGSRVQIALAGGAMLRREPSR